MPDPENALAVLRIKNATLDALAIFGNYAPLQSGFVCAFGDFAGKRCRADALGVCRANSEFAFSDD